MTNEPTEASVLRMMLARMDASIKSLSKVARISTWDKRSLARIRTEATALRACMKAAGWDTGEDVQPDENDPLSGQSILDAG